VRAVTREPKRGAATRPTDETCAERLAICAESGDVSEARARELAADDARRCAEGGVCLCRQ